jgi:hypothetical protein
VTVESDYVIPCKQSQELVDDSGRWNSPVWERKVAVLKSSAKEDSLIVQFLIQANYPRYIPGFERLYYI